MYVVVLIPLEIEKLGEEAIKVYHEALNEGKEMIPYCSLLLLGREEVGKTSLFRQLVRKPFLKDLERTRGIDNEAVETVQRIDIDTTEEKWFVKKDLEPNEQFRNALAGEFIDKLPEKHPETIEQITENELLMRLNELAKPILQQDKLSDEPVLKKSIGTSGKKPQHKINLKVTESDVTHTAQPVKEVKGFLNSRDSAILNKIVTHKQTFKKRTPSVIFNVNDFAGQPVYRSMHHCFISERGLFVVIFKLPDMLKFIHNPDTAEYNPLNDIRYWTRSIHAHITPRIQSKNARGERPERVLLVGTHRDELQPEGLKEIEKFIEDELILNKHERVIDRIHRMSSSSDYAYFIPVENSIDCKTRTEDYFEESGAKCVQDTIKTMSISLPHLKEYHPIKWLKYEELLKQQRCIHNSAPVLKIEEVNELGVKSGIINKKQQELALKFFHEEGKIICLSKYIHYNVVDT